MIEPTLFALDQSLLDTPSLSPSSTYTGLDACEWSTRSASPYTDQEYYTGLSEDGRLDLKETAHLLLKPYSSIESGGLDMFELDRLWLDLTMPSAVSTDAFPQGDIDFVASEFNGEPGPLTVDSSLLFANDLSELSAVCINIPA